MSADTVAVDREKWGRLLYLLYRERFLIAALAPNARAVVPPEWDDLPPKERRAWVSDASEFIRAWEQKRQQMSDVLSAAVRTEYGKRIAAAIEAKRDALHATAEGTFDDHVRDLTDREMQGMDTALEVVRKVGGA